MESVISLIKSFYSNKKLIRAVVYSILVISVIITLIPTYIREVKPNLHNIYLFQADAFLHGRLSVGDADELKGYELSLFNGKKYVCLPPFPAVVLMPFVAIWDIEKIHVSLIGIVLTLFSIFLLKKILEQLKIEREKIPWILCAFMLGSAYWWCFCRSGAPWLTAHVVAVACILLAIHEALGKGRGFLIGTYLGMAILSRQLSVYCIFFLCCVLWSGGVNKRIETNGKKMLNIAFLLIGTGIWISLYLVFNWARFGNPFDTGYAYISHAYHLKTRIAQYGLFNIAYIPFNFTYMFLQGFNVVFGGKDMLTIQWPDTFGTSITFASPFVFYAF